MARVKSRDTGPEMIVRRIAHGLGYRYRLHRADLPGKPDLVFPASRCVIFVHGCFWHGHEGCSRNRRPSSRTDYWVPKLERNRQRDAKNERTLLGMGWRVLVIWECETRDKAAVAERIDAFLTPSHGL
jgi:DNA mismatch endonuclease (patch repair protein)